MEELLKSERLSAIKAAIQNDCLNLPALGANADAAKRNDLVLAYMLVVDQAYYAYESDLMNDSRLGNFVATIASLGLATSGAATGGKTARVLSAMNTGVIGEREAFNKEFLLNETIPAMKNQMRAGRAGVATRIYGSLAKGVSEYPTCLALQHLAEYEQAGTLVGALGGITQASSDAKRENEEAASDALLELEFDGGGLASALRAYLAPEGDDPLMVARVTRATGPALVAAGLSPDPGETAGAYVSRITADARFAAEQRALALGLLATETNVNARALLIEALKK